MIRLALCLGLAALMFSAKAPAQSPGDAEAGFRVRADVSAPLNADTGWAGDLNEAVTINADRPFRLRFVTQSPPGDAEPNRFRLQVRRNGGDWTEVQAHDFPLPQRKIELDFTQAEPGVASVGWSGGLDLNVIRTAQGGAVLRAGAGALNRFSLYTPPWPLEDLVLGAEFRVPTGADQGFSLVFGFRDPDNHLRVSFNPQADDVQVVEIVNGEATVLARQPADLVAGDWIEAEVERIGEELIVNLHDDAIIFTVPLQGAPASEQAGIHIPAPGSVELRSFTLEGQPRTPPVSIVQSRAFSHGEVTAPLLSAAAAFQPGLGVSLQSATPEHVAPPGSHSEFEWPLVIRRFADGAVLTEDGDVFEFRMIDLDGAAANAGSNPQITLSVPDGHLGGTFVETPGRIGPFQASNGDLYFIMEPTETDYLFMMMKSSDDGLSWREADGLSRPATGDLESVDARQIGDTIHIIHQITEAVFRHAFLTSDHATQRDQWSARDEMLATGDAVSQMATLAVRSDGSQVIVYLDDTLRYAVRNRDGEMSPIWPLDPDAGEMTAGPQAVLGAEDAVHIAYYEADGTLWHRRLNQDGSLTARQWLADGAGETEDEFGAVLPLVYLEGVDTLVIAYRLADGGLWERRIVGGGPPSPPVRVTDRRVITNAVDSQQPAADLVADGANLHALFVDMGDRNLYLASDCGGGWIGSVLQVADIDGSWVRGGVYTRSDGVRVYGYVYDAGSEGGAGMNRFGEIKLTDINACQ